MSTPLNIEKLRQYLNHHPDQYFVNYLVDGFTNGFDTGIQELPSSTLECKNLLSARNQTEITQSLIEKELEKGFLAGPYDVMPFPIYRVNPIGVAEGRYSNKKRLIVDLSAPHNDSLNPSLNQLIDKEEYSLQYVKLDHAIDIIKSSGVGSWMCKTDISDAFKLVPIHPSLWPYHAIKWEGKYYFYTRLVFGSRSSPKIFDSLSRAICWIASNVFNIQNILHLLDDFLTIDSPEFLADRTMALLLMLFKTLNIPLASHKTIGPTTCLEYLGIILDSTSLEARLPVNKVHRINNILVSFLDKKSCTKRELLSLLGHLNFASRVIRPGRSFVSHLIFLSTKVKELHHYVKLDTEVRSEIRMWQLFLQEWNGVSFFLDDNITAAADMHLFTDATDKAFGGIFQNKWFQSLFPKDLLILDNHSPSMALIELYPIVIACFLWGKQWNKKRILFHCDNMATVQILNKGRSKNNVINKLMRMLTWITAQCNFTVHAEHVPGKLNDIADAISRFQMKKFRSLAPDTDPHPTPCPQLQELMKF